MYLVTDLSKKFPYTLKVYDTKDVGDVVIGITGDQHDGDFAEMIANCMDFGVRPNQQRSKGHLDGHGHSRAEGRNGHFSSHIIWQNPIDFDVICATKMPQIF